MKIVSFLTLGLAAAVAATAPARAAEEPYSAYVARVSLQDVLISRNGQVVLTHAVEDGKHILRGWRLENGDGVQIGMFEPRRWGAGAFEKVFALSFDGRHIAQNYCEIIGKSSKGVGGFIGGLVGRDDTPSVFAGQTRCERVSLYDWSGKERESNKYEDNEDATGKGAPCGLSFGPDGRVYACGRSGMLGRQWDYYDSIKVFRPDLKFQTNFTFGYMPTTDGFIGRAQIYGFRISDTGADILAWGFGYYTNETPNPDAHPHRGGQVWKAPLPAADCTGSRCLPREKETYLFRRDHPARQESLEKENNALFPSTMIFNAFEVADVVTIQHVFSFEPSKEPAFEIFNKKEGSEYTYRWDSGPFMRFDASFYDKIAFAVPPIASRDGSLLFKLYGDTGNIDGRWLTVSKTESRDTVVVDRIRGYLGEDETPLSMAFPDDSTDVLLVTDRRIARIPGPAPEYVAAAAIRAKSLELEEAGFAGPAQTELLKAVKTSPAWSIRTAPNISDMLRIQMAASKSPYSAVQLGQLALAAAEVFANADVGARIGYRGPDGGTPLDPPLIGALNVDQHPLTGIVQAGDRIVAVAGQPVYREGDLSRVMNRLKAGQTVEIALTRDGAPINAQTRLLARPGIYAESDIWARYGLMAVQYGHPDIARAAANRLRELYARAQATGSVFSDGGDSAANLIDILVLGETQGADAAYQAVLNQGGQLQRLAAALVISFPRAARVLYEDPKKLAYILGDHKPDEFEMEFAVKAATAPRTPQPFVDLAGNIRQVATAAATPSAPTPDTAAATPPATETTANAGDQPPPASPGGKVLD